MTILEQMLEDTKSVAILGHIRPDGDCLGSTLGLYNYLRLNYPDIRAAVYLEESSPKFNYLKGYDEIRHRADGENYELCVCLDSGDIQRLGDFKHYLDRADKSLCLDHHVTNTRYGGTNVVPDEASSTCEVLFDQLDEEKIDRHTAECLYTGIVHDTGVFKYSNTSRRTMEIAGYLMDQGIDFPKIIDGSFYQKSYGQIRVHGQTMLDSVLFEDGRCIYTVVTQEELKKNGCTVKSTDGIVDLLRSVTGVECAILLYETGNPSEYKVSLRTNTELDLSRIALAFGGGGHKKAAGCTMTGTVEEIIRQVDGQIRIQWGEEKEQTGV